MVRTANGVNQMSREQWEMAFRAGETLETEIKSRPFSIIGFGEDGVSVRLLSRNNKPTIVLRYDRLDAIFKRRRKVIAGPLTWQINRAWKKAGLGKDTQNESQYWTLVCVRFRRAKEQNSDLTYTEGGRIVFTSSRFERNPKLRKACIGKHGSKCIVCKLDFAERYGDVGKGFIHIHHLSPLSEVDAKHQVNADDVVPVCANCHAMLHQKTPPYTPQALRQLIAKAGTKAQ